ncbi:hypothetical protein GJ744_001125 [Endocarpon pusillum]|uniref:Rrp15p-domain-containing protein n=1 Tax=Endocarpon pusillum TaxID=364733 RepID=A0A8H7ACN0_9EURO|nr:hypothetical protein GJ744_001125 [Endocarpon pusillum]
MAPLPSQKRKIEDAMRGRTERPKKRVRKQKEYHSSSEDADEASGDDCAPFDLVDSDDNAGKKSVPIDKQGNSTDTSITGRSSDSEDDASSLSSDEEGDDAVRPGEEKMPTSKRNDPDAFSTSISKILSTKLSQSARKDPVLSRSREAADISNAIANEKLERRAKAKICADRQEELERGRVKDVLGLQSGMAGEVAEEEKKLRKIAQRGVVKLFNAVRAAQVKAEEAAREARKNGTVGYANREEKINEMSKQGFLALINGDSKNKPIDESR